MRCWLDKEGQARAREKLRGLWASKLAPTARKALNKCCWHFMFSCCVGVAFCPTDASMLPPRKEPSEADKEGEGRRRRRKAAASSDDDDEDSEAEAKAAEAARRRQAGKRGKGRGEGGGRKQKQRHGVDDSD